VVEPEDPQPFLRFLGDSIAAHGPDLLSKAVARYRRFIHVIDPAPLLDSNRLSAALRDWQPALARWIPPAEAALRPLATRWLAHRFSLPMLKGRGELRESCDGIVHLYAASLRYAGASARTRALQGRHRQRRVLLPIATFAARGVALVRRRALNQAGWSLNSVISAGAKTRIGGPQNPVPRLT